ncbi:MAG: hypothetical protein HY855_06650 [Burkholderiales bacterium]|nr:hypothetical protein [Burkholderiales bacterium]
MNRCITTLGLATALALGAGAQAAVVSVSFQVTIDSQGSLLGQVFSGQARFDDQAWGPGFGGAEASALVGFDFHFAGQHYQFSDLVYGDAVRSGGSFGGLDALAAVFNFLPATGTFGASFGYDFGNGEAGTGAVSFALPPVPVPEPATPALAGAALLLALAAARRQRQR